jgi:hypothetical protein
MLQLMARTTELDETPDSFDLETARAEEARRGRRLAFLVECTERELRRDARMTRARAEALVDTTRDGVLDLFPGSEPTYNMLLAPGFNRLMDELFGVPAARTTARVLAFRPRHELAPSPTVELEMAAGD